jgi:ankyrin repeat protein
LTEKALKVLSCLKGDELEHVNYDVTPLFALAYSNVNDCFTYEITETLLRSNVSVHDRHGESILFHCVCATNNKLLQWLLTRGGWGEYDLTCAFTKAMCIKDLPGAKLLRSHGADVFAFHKDDVNGLHLGIMYNSLEMVQTMIEWGVDVQQTTASGNFPLTMATQRCKDVNIIYALLAAGAPPNTVSSTSISALQSAIDNDQTEVAVRLLALGADPFHRTMNNINALHYACKKHNELMVRMLVDLNVDFNLEAGPQKWTPMDYCFVKGVPRRIIDYLREKGAKVHPHRFFDNCSFNNIKISLEDVVFILRLIEEPIPRRHWFYKLNKKLQVDLLDWYEVKANEHVAFRLFVYQRRLPIELNWHVGSFLKEPAYSHF